MGDGRRRVRIRKGTMMKGEEENMIMMRVRRRVRKMKRNRKQENTRALRMKRMKEMKEETWRKRGKQAYHAW